MKTLSQIYQQYSPDVYRFALGLCGDPVWADDLAAETFVRAFVSSKPIRLETVKAYLFTITRNLYLQEIRKHKRLVSLDEEMADKNPGLEASVQDRDHLRVVMDGLQKFPEIDRTVLLMRAQEELPYADIAASLGLSLSAVKVKIYRARQKMNVFMKEYENENYE